jgi:ABC-type polysaccharide/polyol phosphate export permease
MTSAATALPRRRKGLYAELLKLRAFLRRDFLTAVSYRLSFAADFANVVVAVFMFYLVGRMVDRQVLPTFNGVRPTYMEYVATGIVLGAFVQIGVGRVTRAVEREQTGGTLESLLITPTATPTILLGSVVYDLVYVPVRTAMMLLVIALAFGLDYHASGLPAAALFLLLFIPFVWGVGMVSAALNMTFRKGSGVFTAFITLLTVGSGAYVPVSLLPGPAASFAPYNPVGVASHGMRESLFAGGWSAADAKLLTLPALAAISIAAGVVALRLAMRRERRLGTVGLY